MPLPAFSVRTEWTRNFQVAPGMTEAAMKPLEATVREFHDTDRLSVVTFDEMRLDNTLAYGQARDHIIGASKVQVVVISGLAGSW